MSSLASLWWVWVKNFFPSGPKKSLRVGSESTRVKGGSASYLLQVKNKLGSGQGPSLASLSLSFEKKGIPRLTSYIYFATFFSSDDHCVCWSTGKFVNLDYHSEEQIVETSSYKPLLAQHGSCRFIYFAFHTFLVLLQAKSYIQTLQTWRSALQDDTFTYWWVHIFLWWKS